MMFRSVRVEQLIGKIRNRVTSLVVPYLCWNIIYFLLSLKGRTNITLRNVIDSVFFYSDNAVTWYLFNLIVYTAFCYPIYYLLKNKFVGLALISVFVALQLFNIPFPMKPRWDAEFYYLIGAWLGMHASNIVETSSKRKSILGLIGILALLGGFIFGSKMQISALKSISLIGCCLLVWFVLDLITLPKLPANISSISFIIYVTHIIIVCLISRIVSAITPITPLIALLLFFIYPALVLLFSVYFVKLAEKSKLASLCLFGGRGVKPQYQMSTPE
ncbi:MAG: acyltransferase family protein [Oscillospiraceae bacterium]